MKHEPLQAVCVLMGCTFTHVHTQTQHTHTHIKCRDSDLSRKFPGSSKPDNKRVENNVIQTEFGKKGELVKEMVKIWERDIKKWELEMYRKF